MHAPLENIETVSLTKAELRGVLCDTLGLSLLESAGFVDEFFTLISEKLKQGEEVKIAGFGTFKVREKSARPGRNPRTGTPAQIKKRKTVTFSSGPKQKRQLLDASFPSKKVHNGSVKQVFNHIRWMEPAVAIEASTVF